MSEHEKPVWVVINPDVDDEITPHQYRQCAERARTVEDFRKLVTQTIKVSQKEYREYHSQEEVDRLPKPKGMTFRFPKQ